MSARPDRDFFETVASDLGVDASFVEKDWRAMQVVAIIAGVKHDTIQPVFSGGTSLSKGYELIHRFSEDLDFKLLIPDGGIPRSERTGYRKRIIETVRSAGGWAIGEVGVHNDSKFFSCQIAYENIFSLGSALRPYIRLEMTFGTPALDPVQCSLRSFVAQARTEDPEVPTIACVSLTETAADKLSALTWRVLTRHRGAENDDATFVRHMYDLEALEPRVRETSEFAPLAKALLEIDAARGGPSAEVRELEAEDRLKMMLEKLSEDRDYRVEYDNFAANMSYASEGEKPGFDQALAAVHRLVEPLT